MAAIPDEEFYPKPTVSLEEMELAIRGIQALLAQAQLDGVDRVCLKECNGRVSDPRRAFVQFHVCFD